MIRLDSRQRVPEPLRGAIVALGNFDGFHLGHQAVVAEALRWARAENRPGIIATFEPHPLRFFVPDAAPFRLTTLDQRQELFANAGADAMLVVAFDAAMAATTAPDWVSRVVAGDIGAGGVITGTDYTFGKGRTGDTALLQALGAAAGVAARSVAAVSDAQGVISSSRIRAALQAGDPVTAAHLLTRPFAIRGVVQHGEKLGRTIGYPTANIPLGSYLRPAYGIYAVTARLPDGRIVPGAASLGIRPSFSPPRELLEAYLFDYTGDLYGAEIEVALHHYLRPEAKFDDLASLSAQMERDCDEARKLLSAGTP